MFSQKVPPDVVALLPVTTAQRIPVSRRRCRGVRRAQARRRRAAIIRAGLSHKAEDSRQGAVAEPLKKEPLVERDVVRIGLPSKGRMAEDTMQLLTDCQLSVYKPNPRQYVAKIPQVDGIRVVTGKKWNTVHGFRCQESKRGFNALQTSYGDVDLGFVGYDMFRELAEDDSDVVLIHEALQFGKCYLALGIPQSDEFSDVHSLEDLRKMPRWSETRPLRVVTGYSNIARRFFSDKELEHVVLLSGDGALEAAPAMGSADAILDLVSTGVTLRENNLREIEGGRVLESQGVLIGNRQSLLTRRGLLRIVRELLDRLDAHLKAVGYYSVVANMRGSSPTAIAEKLHSIEGLAGLQGPTLSPVYSKADVNTTVYAACICVKKPDLYRAVKELRKGTGFWVMQLGGSGVLVQPMTYIFDEESVRWQQLLKTLNVAEESVPMS